MINTLFVLGQPLFRRSASSLTHSGSVIRSFPALASNLPSCLINRLNSEAGRDINCRSHLYSFNASPATQLDLNHESSVPWYRITDMPIFDEPPPQPKISELGLPCVDSAQVIDSILDLTLPSDKPDEAPILAVKRTYQPSVIVSYSLIILMIVLFFLVTFLFSYLSLLV